MKKIYLLFIFCVFYNSVFAQDRYVNFFMMNQEIKNTLKEHERQKEMHKKETQNLALEKTNRSKWTKLKKVVKKIQSRLSIVDLGLQAIPTGVQLTKKIDEIKRNQKSIFKEAKTLPPNIKSIIDRQITFIKDSQMVLRLIVGLVASYGAINQMEKAERKILLDYAVDEMEELRRQSSFTLFLIREAKHKMRMKKVFFKYYIEKDKKVINDIIKQIKKY